MKVIRDKANSFLSYGGKISREEKVVDHHEVTRYFQEFGNVNFVFDLSVRLQDHLQFQTCWVTLSIISQ
jgi:hypothetical protein